MKKHFFRLVVVILLLTIGSIMIILFKKSNNSGKPIAVIITEFLHHNKAPEQPYSTILEHIRIKQLEFSKLLNQNSDHDIVISDAKSYLETMLADTIFDYWYGTPWDFNGTTREPGKGQIACGYFVTNTLTDLGFKIPRIKWAQSASEVFIKILVDNIMRFHNAEINDVEKYLIKNGNGIYLVGLDNHVGYIVFKEDEIKFVHSNYDNITNMCVISEDIDGNNPLKNSKYRVIGKLFGNQMVKNWIQGQQYFYESH